MKLKDTLLAELDGDVEKFNQLTNEELIDLIDGTLTYRERCGTYNFNDGNVTKEFDEEPASYKFWGIR